MSDNADTSSSRKIAVERKASSSAFKWSLLIISVPCLLSIAFLFSDENEKFILGIAGIGLSIFLLFFLQGKFYPRILKRELAALVCPECDKELALSTSTIDTKLISTVPRRTVSEFSRNDGPNDHNGFPTWVNYNRIEEWTEERWQTKYKTGCSYCSYNKVFTENSTRKTGGHSYSQRR